MFFTLLFCGFAVGLAKVSPEAERLTGQELVDYVNRHQNLWTAKLNPNADEDMLRMTGLIMEPEFWMRSRNLAESRFLDIDLPKEFDARKHWPECKSIQEIRDQSHCGSCWAFGSVEAMSDRICIASKGKIQVHLSTADVLSCGGGKGCHGGTPITAWAFWNEEGIVTGSNYTAKQGCKPYPFQPCDHTKTNKTHFPLCKSLPHYEASECEKKCQESYTEKTYKEDKHYGREFYIVEDNVEAIQKEIYTNGPVSAAFDIYTDFGHYNGGIYSHQAGARTPYGHLVKIIGWGEEKGTPYWLIANSWNTDWAENGFFRMLRGNDECGIESAVVGGLPDFNRTRIN